MTDQPLDMHLPETFHRLKRTVLVFSAAFALLGLGVPAGKHTIHSGWLDIELTTAVVRWMLWLGGLYYLAGFLLEAQSALLINSKQLLGTGLGQLERSLEDLHRRAANVVAGLETSATQYAKSAEIHAEALEKYLKSYSFVGPGEPHVLQAIKDGLIRYLSEPGEAPQQPGQSLPPRASEIAT
ncbi:hypothetical protein ACETK8_14120 [Brevundimonas staleyi]|uniref:Uncharacterized protein n=1 Tax=Brevundimonas staleyi TaxID=74326 RepID=A0ABW0FX92_9CAUL